MDSVQATGFLARAGLQITAATKTCLPQLQGDDFTATACAADAAGIFSSFGWVATYLSLAASHCAFTVNLPAICAATVAGTVADFAQVAVQASFVAAHCTKKAGDEDG